MTIVEVLENSDSNIIRIFIVRHGQTDHNKLKILQGHLDISLNSTGEKQAKILAKHFESIPIDYFISSDLKRCKETLEPVLEIQPKDVKYTSNLRERNMGKVQGMYLKDALATYGENFRNLGETEIEFTKRVEYEWNKLLDTDYKNIFLCTHGGVITRLANYLNKDLGYKLNHGLDESKLRVPFNTSITVVDYKRTTQEGLIVDFGNTLHLGGQFEVKDQLLR
ncbi:unnamed protein product [Candida verbasci]|uniref:Phosphoglycerate mutase n=1 Tax=Candida verbasci TaxID=1227364 RepID=A0A9W4X9W9_9ASCO|nr:unnamed protein product [Candida verbasci]